MLLLELLEDVHLLLLVGGRAAQLLLLLVVHHLLHHAAGLAVQVGQLGRLGCDFCHVDLGGILDDVRPPFHLVDLVQVDLDGLGAVCIADESPGGVVWVDCMGQFSIDEGVLASDPSKQLLLLDLDDQVPRLEVAGDGDGDVNIANGLCPFVWQGSLFGLLPCAGRGFFCRSWVWPRRFVSGGVAWAGRQPGNNWSRPLENEVGGFCRALG